MALALIMSQASEVYAQLLLPKRLGFPLWNPAPDKNLLIEYQEKGVSIGDVGIITQDGEFDFLFNICIPTDSPINRYGVPVDFENVSESIQISRNTSHHAPGTTIASNSTEDRAINANASVQDNPCVNPVHRFVNQTNLESATFLLERLQVSISLSPLQRVQFSCCLKEDFRRIYVTEGRSWTKP
jgi:hypothetical protein